MNKPLDHQLELGVAEMVEAPESAPNNLPAVVELPSDEFDWCDDDSIILRHQPETAAYLNQNNGLVIRQRNWPDDDSYVVISASNIHDFLDKITDVGGIPSAGKRR